MMIRFYTLGIYFLIWLGCRDLEDQPIWINRTSIIHAPTDSLIIKTNSAEWVAVLTSFIQPIPLQRKVYQDHLVFRIKNNAGLVEGPAELILEHTGSGKKYFYSLLLKNNDPGKITVIDYRSPKTVNPDSSLNQQSIVHKIDQWRNIVTDTVSPNLFFEKILEITPKAGIYQAQENKPISSFYVQPGSVEVINLVHTIDVKQNIYKITAGPLKDRFQNQLADGTLVVFIYRDQQEIYRRLEKACREGFAQVTIPSSNEEYVLHVQIGDRNSQEIILKNQ